MIFQFEGTQVVPFVIIGYNTVWQRRTYFGRLLENLMSTLVLSWLIRVHVEALLSLMIYQALLDRHFLITMGWF